MVKEEIDASILDVYVIAESITPVVTGYAADRFEAGAPLIFQLYEVHRTVCTNTLTGNYFIAYLKNTVFFVLKFNYFIVR